MSYATAHDRRLPAALAAAGVQVLLVFLIIRGLAAHYLDPSSPAREANLVVLAEFERPPPPPQSDSASDGAPPAVRAEPRPQEAPPPKLVLADPRPAPTHAGSGTAAIAGIAQTAGLGSGQGGGGTGDGTGLGAGGSGSGGGAASPPQRIAGNLSDRDYPRSAAARGAAGTVAIGFRIGLDGAVSRCAVIESSGDAVLDQLTCSLVVKRFRYRAARNAGGDPVETTLRTTFTWGTYRN